MNGGYRRNRRCSKEENLMPLREWSFSALAIAIHNFPEGLATFISTLQDPALGISIAIAIAIHNIPEGVAVSVLYIMQQEVGKKPLHSFLSGLQSL